LLAPSWKLYGAKPAAFGIAVAGKHEDQLGVSTPGSADEADRTTSDYPASDVFRSVPARGDESLYALLERDRTAIIERFVRCVRDEKLAGNTPRAVLIDDLSFFLADLADTLRGGPTRISDHARDHGNRRHRLGFQLDVVLREYAVLRRCIYDSIRDAGVMPLPDELARLGAAIDTAMMDAALAYAKDRDAELKAERETLMEERERLRRAIGFRDEVLAIVSHDLRNPLASISLGVDQLRRYGQSDPSRRERILDSVKRAAQRMATLIEDLLAIAKIDAGQLALRRSAQPAHALVDDALAVVAPQAESKSIRLVANVPDDLAIECDRDRLLQVLGNLIGNAIKFTPERGEITVDAVAHESIVRFRVRDNGPGIPAEALPYVFDRFYQGPGRRPGGAGLGLAIARAVVEAHDGEIGVESVLGEGTTFWFTVALAAGT
jgi:signal transduction histidine kinase